MYNSCWLLLSEFREGPGIRIYLEDFPLIQIALELDQERQA